jgi:hypothetical protein
MEGGGKILTKFWSENLKGGDHLKYPGVGGSIMLKWI